MTHESDCERTDRHHADGRELIGAHHAAAQFIRYE